MKTGSINTYKKKLNKGLTIRQPLCYTKYIPIREMIILDKKKAEKLIALLDEFLDELDDVNTSDETEAIYQGVRHQREELDYTYNR